MQQIARSVALALNSLSRSNSFMLGSFTILTFLVIAIWRPNIYYYNFIPIVENFKIKKSKVYKFLQETNEQKDQFTLLQKDETILQEKLNNRVLNEVYDHEYIISIGDKLNYILNRYDINIDNINQLIVIDKELCDLKVGQQIFWRMTTNGNLQHLMWEISHQEMHNYDRIGNAFRVTSKLQQGDWINFIIKGIISDNFTSSAYDAGLTSNETSAVIKAMQWQADFRKLKKGDRFSVLMSREIFNSKREQSQLLGVHLKSSNKDYYAICAENGKFYDRNGTELTKGFLRFPTTKQFRISSNFNLHRLNPITGRIMPHRGVDFAMPQGTPVLAVGDGEVGVAKHSDAAGFYITVHHSNTYTTRYMHLYKILVKPGQKVKRGDLIALSGNTGSSTGPHLHYEVWINKQAVNPLTAKLPNIEGLIGKDRYAYLIQTKEVISKLQFD